MNTELAPDARALLDTIAAQPPLSFADMSPTEARAAALAIGASLDLPGAADVESCDLAISADDGHSIPLRSYRAHGVPETGPVVLFLHGGGWVTGDLDTHDSFCRQLARDVALRIVAVDYRRPPEYAFPAAVDDALAAARTILDPDGLLSGVTGLALAGDSVGGGLAAALASILSGEGADLRAQLLLYPVLDLNARAASYAQFAQGYLLSARDMEHFITSYVPDAALRTDPRCSPLRSNSLTGLPPTFVLTCGFDVLRDEGRTYASRCAEAEVSVHHVEAAGQIHGIATLRAALPSAAQPLRDVIAAFARSLEQSYANSDRKRSRRNRDFREDGI